MNNLPEKIYLQIGSNCDHDVDFNKLVGVTWNKDRVYKNDIEYVRADLLRWNKVKDCLPKNGDNVQVNHELIEATFLHGKFFDVDDGYVMDVYEWRNIIE